MWAGEEERFCSGGGAVSFGENSGYYCWADSGGCEGRENAGGAIALSSAAAGRVKGPDGGRREMAELAGGRTGTGCYYKRRGGSSMDRKAQPAGSFSRASRG